MKKTIVIGVTGSIAAYKAADLTSRLVKLNYSVTVIMTESAKKLICEQTFFTISQNPVISDLWGVSDWKPEHIALAEKCDLFVVAPSTANFIGKFTNGIADDALTTFALSRTCKVLIAPAMNTHMWEQPAVQSNCKILSDRGVHFIGPGSGFLACGTTGAGRLIDIPIIVDRINELLK